jgi:pyruvate, orthophosphate dikinase
MAVADLKESTPVRRQLTVAFHEGDPTRLDLLGGKGAGLVRMSQAGLPVPPGFVIMTDACPASVEAWSVPAELMDEVRVRVAHMEKETGRTFGCAPAPLLVSVRSGAKISMPGMMDTILNLGLNVESAAALASQTNDLGFVVDIYIRFARMYGEIVLGADGDLIADAAQGAAAEAMGGTTEQVLAAVETAIENTMRADVGAVVPNDPHEQLTGAIHAVFASWNSRRAVTYREVHNISHDLGTAVVVQAMVFGNLGSPSGTGVAFTRNPLTGEHELYGEFLEGGQGEDVVAGTKTPEKLAVAAERLPAIFHRFREVATRLEEVYGDALDIEFTVERGELYLLQVRSAKRTAVASIRVAADLLGEGKLSTGQALAKVSTSQVRLAERPRFDEQAVDRAVSGGALLGSGIGACPGHASGKAVLDAERAVEFAGNDGSLEDVILVRPTTSPQDLHGMLAARGFVTATGGATSHAAVVARALDKPCVVGSRSLWIDEANRRFAFGDRWFAEGDPISLDGSSGQIYSGVLPLANVAVSSDSLERLLRVADDAARCRIFARAATPEHVADVIAHGATGITTRVGDLLATHGRLEDLLDLLVKQRDSEHVELAGLDNVIADLLKPMFAAASAVPFAIRALDLVGDEAMELLDAPALLAKCPRLAVPVGLPELIAAQVRGVALAARAAGCQIAPQLSIRHVNDPNEAREIMRLADQHLSPEERSSIRVGATLSSPRGVQLAEPILGALEFVWIELRGLQAAQFGYPPRLMLTREPLDGYLRRGMISSDPRTTIAEATIRLIGRVAAARVTDEKAWVGVRLSGAVEEDIAGGLLRAGFRAFAVDGREVYTARLALGKAALAEELRL